MTMTAFNPKNNQLSPQEWQSLAAESIDNDNSQYIIIAGIVGGLIAASATGFPPTGLLIAAWSVQIAWKKTQAINRNEVAINQYGCIAHTLKGDNLRQFRRQVGDEEVLKQIQWAAENGYPPTVEALDLLETANKFHRRPAMIAPSSSPTFSAPAQTLPVAQPITTQSQTYAPTPQEFDVIGRMTKDLTNHLIVGVPGSGKGILMSNAIDSIKKQKPNVTIYYIDPKGDEKETGYFDGRVDYLRRAKAIDMSPFEVVKWFKECVNEFQSIPEDKLLVVDEGTIITSKFKNAGKGEIGWLKDKIVSYCSCGDSIGLRIWIVVQNAHTDDLGVNGGIRSQLVPIAIINPKNVAAYGAIISTTLIPADRKLPSSEIMEVAGKSPVSRAIYHGGINEWMPMPKLANFSGYNRDERQFERSKSQPKNQTELLIQKLESTDKSLDRFISEELGLSGEKALKMKGAIAKILETNPSLNKKFHPARSK